jgi:hypothetical protein
MAINKMTVKKKDGGILDAMDSPASGRGLAAKSRDDANQDFNRSERNFDNMNKQGQYGSRDLKQQALSGKQNPKAGAFSTDPMNSSRDGVRNLAQASQKKRSADDYANKTGLESHSMYADNRSDKKRKSIFGVR